MFVPKQVRLSIKSLCLYFAVVYYCMKEITRWVGMAILLGRVITNANLEEKLFRKGWLRKSDWKKISWLFQGWGDSNVDEYENDMKAIADRISRGRIKYWKKREEDLRCEVSEYQQWLQTMFDSVVWTEIMYVKGKAVESEWMRSRMKMKDKLHWFIQSGVCFKDKKILFEHAKSDDYLFDKFGRNNCDKLGLSWAKLSPRWGLKLEFEVEF